MKEKINVAVIGLGCRGSSMLSCNICKMEDVNIIGICDVYEDRVKKSAEDVVNSGREKPFCTLDYKEILSMPELDSVYIATSWETHIEIAIEAMEKGVIPAIEVGGAASIDICRKLVDTYEKTGVPLMFMENCCYGENEMVVHNMVRKGLFGKVVFCSGCYSHDLRDEVAYGTKNRHYRLKHYLNENKENYPTHELGPIAKILDINRGNRFVSLYSLCSESHGMADYVDRHEDLHEELLGKSFAQADIVKTFLKTERGELVELTLDTTLPQSYTRGFTVRGTRGMYEEERDMLVVDGEKPDNSDHTHIDKLIAEKKYDDEYLPEIWKNTTEEMLSAGHGGMDWFVLRAWIDCVKSGTLPPIDVYDAVTWMVVSALSEESLRSGKSVDFPDFTNGKYKNRTDHAEGAYEIK
ncbi:MAG: Gfo/Idh/MocA family oxidoreductase [Clostridia bacterium]|nr:Gfo/Idh/MocA family oxidoreductase [Clostridia bacterium]